MSYGISELARVTALYTKVVSSAGDVEYPVAPISGRMGLLLFVTRTLQVRFDYW
jgi:hypothetical protein